MSELTLNFGTDEHPGDPGAAELRDAINHILADIGAGTELDGEGGDIDIVLNEDGSYTLVNRGILIVSPNFNGDSLEGFPHFEVRPGVDTPVLGGGGDWVGGFPGVEEFGMTIGTLHRLVFGEYVNLEFGVYFGGSDADVHRFPDPRELRLLLEAIHASA